MSDSEPMRFGIIGAGGIAQAYAQAFGQSDQAKLCAVADTRIESAEAMAEANDCAAFSSAEAMVGEMDFDAVVVSTPPNTHRDVCCDLMSQGLHVLCEKPLAIDSTSAQEMIGVAKQNDVVFSMASKFRYVADVTAAKAIVESGLIGEVVMFENVFTGHVDMSQRWNSNPAVSGGGVLIDNGTHSVDITRYFLGGLAEVQVMEGNRIQDLQVEDTVRMFVRSEQGVLGSIDLSWSVSKEQPYFIAIYGSAGTLLIGWQESKYRRASDKDWEIIGSGYNKVDAFKRQIENFAGAIQGRESLVVTSVDGLASVQVIEAAYRAMQKGAWEPILAPGLNTASA
ncbi:MAG: Gfo/Idh/MocA family oxidoreductase [Planctomycetota bacterium]